MCFKKYIMMVRAPIVPVSCTHTQIHARTHKYIRVHTRINLEQNQWKWYSAITESCPKLKEILFFFQNSFPVKSIARKKTHKTETWLNWNFLSVACDSVLTRFILCVYVCVKLHACTTKLKSYICPPNHHIQR